MAKYKKYDYLIVGAGLYGASLARLLTDRGYSVLVAERRDHIAGIAYTCMLDDVCVHVYGAHIFHTDNDEVWEFVNRFAKFNSFRNQPKAYFRGRLYSLPFNMNTFNEMWGVTEPEEAAAIIKMQIHDAGLDEESEQENLEKQAISQVGTDIYEKLIKGYTEKQWGRPCSELPASIIRRIPVRLEYNNDYFCDKYQGVPVCGYTEMVRRMLEGTDVMTGTDFLDKDIRPELEELASMIVFSGQIDEYFDYRYGPLEYRSLRFETETVSAASGPFQDRAVINYTDIDVPWTRIIEHKHFAGCSEGQHRNKTTIITREYPKRWEIGREAFYPVRDEESLERYEKYRKLANRDKVRFGGRLGSFRYYDMDDVIASALADAETLTKCR